MWWNRLSLAITTQRALPKSNLYSWQKYESQALIPNATYAHNTNETIKSTPTFVAKLPSTSQLPNKKTHIFNVYKMKKKILFPLPNAIVAILPHWESPLVLDACCWYSIWLSLLEFTISVNVLVEKAVRLVVIMAKDPVMALLPMEVSIIGCYPRTGYGCSLVSFAKTI